MKNIFAFLKRPQKIPDFQALTVDFRDVINILYFFAIFQSCAKCTSVVAQNSSQADQKVELDFSASKNAIINHPHSKFSIHLPKTSVLFIAHILTDGKGTFVPKVAIKMK